MRLLDYVIAFAGLMIDWLAGYVVIGIVMCFIFPLPGHPIALGIGWRFWPGMIIGLIAGIYHFRCIMRRRQRAN